MILSIHSSAAFQSDSGWPSFWPPVKLPPPSPLAAAASSLWSPKLAANTGGADTALAVDPTTSLYSTQLRQVGRAAPDDGQGHFQMAFLDQRIALMRYDASHAQDAVAA